MTAKRLDPIDKGSRITSKQIRKTLWIVLALGFLLRVWGLDCIPPALNSDELLKAFDGASVYRSGMDHHGHRWPLFFQQSGEYSPPLYIYFAGCFSAPFGVNAYTTRLPSAVMGTLSILTTYLFVLEFAGAETALIAAALTAISPWNVHYSRIGWEAVMEAPVQLAAFWLFLRWTRTRRWRELAACCFVFALTVYTYPSARLFIPLMMLGLLIIYRRECSEHLLHLSVGIFVFLAALLPYILFTFAHYDEMQARWKFLSVFQREDGWRLFLLHYLEHLSPLFLFWKGNPNSLHLLGAGVALAVLFPFFLAGLFFIVKKRLMPHLFLLFWLFAFAIPSSMTYDRYDLNSMPNPLRAICGLNLIEIVSAIGIFFLLGKISSPLWRLWAKAALAAAILVNFSLTAYDYVFRYPASSAPSWQYGLREAVEFLEKNNSDYDRVIVSHNVRLHPVALAVFSGREPGPFSGADYPKYILPFFHYVPIYGDFRHNEYLRYRGVDYGSIARWRNLAPGKNLYLAKAGEIDGAAPIFRNFYPNGDAAYEIYSTDR
ncbi:MAG: glycosyltransferase family 39 protein [Candidatus Omnitrophota bacterium]